MKKIVLGEIRTSILIAQFKGRGFSGLPFVYSIKYNCVHFERIIEDFCRVYILTIHIPTD